MHYLWKSILDTIKDEDVLFCGTVLGCQPSGKNQKLLGKRWSKKSNRMIGSMRDSDEVKNYKTTSIIQLGSLMGRKKFKGPIPKEVKIGLVALVINKNWRRDTDTILFSDTLQSSGLIENDRQIRFKVINGLITDQTNPRIEFYLIKLEE